MSGVGAQQRATYETLTANREGRFVVERPPLFSPAAAAQDVTHARGNFGTFAQMLLPLEYTSWPQECVAHVQSCYIGDWSPLNKVSVRGSGALAFLSWLGMRDLSSFADGQIKHHVQLDGNGWVASEGVLCRTGEEEFVYSAGSADWLVWQLGQGGWDAEATDISPDRFIFGVQGPTSLYVLERATGESLRDIAFNHSRPSSVGAVPVRVLRTGISGELGYELHGPSDGANDVWTAVLEAGADHGIQQLGLRSQAIQHIEAGIATNGLDYLPSSIITPGAPRQFRSQQPPGSFVPTGVTDFFRRPGELGWSPRSGVPKHDFLGREALVAEEAAGGSARVLVGLVWDATDVAQVLTSAFGPGDLVDQMEIPRYNGPGFDQVNVGGEPAGISSGRTLSLALRSTISLCVIHRTHAVPGTDVAVTWGRAGTPQREIRATVAALPFRPDRRRTDVSAL